MTRLTELEDRIAADETGEESRAIMLRLEQASAALVKGPPETGDAAERKRLRTACIAAMRIVETLRTRYQGPP